MNDIVVISAAREGKTLVLTNGVYDIVHAGHVWFLESARALGDLLVVALNSDASAAGLGKGKGRPINTLEDRARVVIGLKAVDFVVSFDEPDPVELVRSLKPDIHVKGGDYRVEELPEAKVVQEYGGSIVVLPYMAGRSTTGIIQKIRELED